MTDIDETIATYLIACAVEGKTKNTVWSYRTSLADFRRVGARLVLPDQVEAYAIRDVYAFLNDLRLRGVGPAFQHRRHREVKAFFSWCRRMELVQENVFARVPLVKLEQQTVQPLSAEEIATLLTDQDCSLHHDAILGNAYFCARLAWGDPSVVRTRKGICS